MCSRTTLFAVVPAVLAAACSPSRFEDLPKPALVAVVVASGGFCTSVYAVDGNDSVWSSLGCGEESGTLERAETRASAERPELDRMMDEVVAFPDDPECDVVSTGGERYRFVRTVPGVGGDFPETRQCEPGVPLVALQLADTMRALAAPPILDGSIDAR